MRFNQYKIVLRCQCPGVWKENGLTVEEFAYEADIQMELAEKLLALGLVSYQGRIDAPRIMRREVVKVQRMQRLRRDLGLNWSGAGLVMDLLEEIDRLEREIIKLKLSNT